MTTKVVLTTVIDTTVVMLLEEFECQSYRGLIIKERSLVKS